MDKKLEATARLIEVMDRLRVECPWDREQTIHSLRNNTIEETFELVDAITADDMAGIKEELGDLLFAVANLARHLKVDSESALEGATARFSERFRAVEAAAKAQGRTLGEMTLDEMDVLWEEAKRAE